MVRFISMKGLQCSLHRRAGVPLSRSGLFVVRNLHFPTGNRSPILRSPVSSVVHYAGYAILVPKIKFTLRKLRRKEELDPVIYLIRHSNTRCISSLNANYCGHIFEGPYEL